MNAAYLLLGICYGRFTNRIRDWRRTKEITTYGIQQLLKHPQIDSIITCLYTNESHTTYRLLEWYNPAKFEIVPELHKKFTQKQTFLNGLKMMRSLENIDFIFVSRFDIMFFENVSTFNYDFQKFNFIFRESGDYWHEHKYVADTFFAFPRKYLETFIDAVQDMIDNVYLPRPEDVINNNLHRSYANISKLVGEENTHFLFDGERMTNGNDVYSLMSDADRVDELQNIGVYAIEDIRHRNLNEL